MTARRAFIDACIDCRIFIKTCGYEEGKGLSRFYSYDNGEPFTKSAAIDIAHLIEVERERNQYGRERKLFPEETCRLDEQAMDMMAQTLMNMCNLHNIHYVVSDGRIMVQ